jgi:Flp pilus assembly protein TadB
VTDTATYSTLFLTLLMMIGLVFFIRASTKDRTEILTIPRPAQTEDALQELVRHFEARAYAVQATDPDKHQVSLRGMVRPSLFLALFLTVLAIIGLICLSLVLVSLFPQIGFTWLGLALLSPAAGWYYWQRARREEQVTVQVQAADTSHADGSGTNFANAQTGSLATITAHRDELIALQQVLKNQ